MLFHHTALWMSTKRVSSMEFVIPSFHRRCNGCILPRLFVYRQGLLQKNQQTSGPFISCIAFTVMRWVSWPLFIFVFPVSISALWWPNIWPEMGFPELFEKQGKSEGFEGCDRRTGYSPETPNLGQNRWCFVPCDLEIWRMTLKNNRASLQCYFKLCATFHSHRWIQTGVTFRKRPIWVKIGNFLSRVTMKLDVWPWKTIGHLSYATSSFVHHFVPIGEFKLELQSGNAQFGSKFTIF